MSRTVKCPHCGKPALFNPENKARPFCSERCRLIDLGEWASEGYKIPAKSTQDEYDDYSTGMDEGEQPFTPTRH
ncbi:DNA gyrase inhibitor YacG [Marinobacterium arenosum]|uniref:DNA gyrase inhibitor YacG n=1 Tax=Marinobacterium arenosum TaxID=2862496 RepID=UPI001C96F5AA|nr:DNA gyrase inhibitor YacG [Marinobacterium arenosum]MBY4676588.1 DNA gyrase inhibitor YacG [Marinobacterium arenosum]